MTISEKFCLRWSDFKENINTAFRNLRKDSEFTDITLACEEGHQVEAHKVILAASSPFFRSMLQKNKHCHPLVYMRGIKASDLGVILDFMYHGEVNIPQEDLDNFLSLAKDLELKGLSLSFFNDIKFIV